MCRRVRLVPKVRRKATWGSRIARSLTFLLLIALSVPGFAEAAKGLKAKPANSTRNSNKRSKEGGETAVIIEFTNDSDAASVIKGFGKVGSQAGDHQGL